MKKIIQKICSLQERVCAFWDVMPLLDAIRLVLTKGRPGKIQIYLRPVARKVVLRRQSTDMQCFMKVFIAHEYHSPYSLSPQVIVDAGANIGMATLFFAQRYPQAHIVAIEPEASNFEMLKQNCQQLPNVTLFRGALWPEDRELKIMNPSADAWGFSISDDCNGSDCPRVAAITMLDILDRVNADRIDLLKLDIEGAELQLFSKNSDQWLGRIHVIAIELHDRLTPGCSHAFYSALVSRKFSQEVRGENVFVKMDA
jgi:FkbM family methyltransferase